MRPRPLLRVRHSARARRVVLRQMGTTFEAAVSAAWVRVGRADRHGWRDEGAVGLRPTFAPGNP